MKHSRIFHSGREEWKWVRVLFAPELDDKGNLTFLNGFVLDIHFRKQIEERQSEPVLARKRSYPLLLPGLSILILIGLTRQFFIHSKKIGEHCRLDHGFSTPVSG